MRALFEKKTMHTECFLCLPQTAQKTQNYARAALVLALIAGYFSGTQNTQNTQTFADCFAPDGTHR